MIINIDNEEPVGIGKSRSKNFDSPKRPPAVAEKGRYHGKSRGSRAAKNRYAQCQGEKGFLKRGVATPICAARGYPAVGLAVEGYTAKYFGGRESDPDRRQHENAHHSHGDPSGDLSLGATRTFAAMLQHLNPGEVTESHRHTASSVYFMIQGSNLYTTADGEQQFMEPGDLLTQPNWTWHGSTNTGSEPAIWFTAMDSPLTQYLNAWFNEK